MAEEGSADPAYPGPDLPHVPPFPTSKHFFPATDGPAISLRRGGGMSLGSRPHGVPGLSDAI